MASTSGIHRKAVTLALAGLALALPGCLGENPAGSTSIWESIGAELFVEGTQVAFDSLLGSFEVTVEGIETIPCALDATAEAVALRAHGSVGPHVDPVIYVDGNGIPVGIERVVGDKVSLRLDLAPHDGIDLGLLTTGFQLATAQNPLRLGPYEIPRAQLQEPRISVDAQVTELNLATNSTRLVVGTVWADFSRGNPFPNGMDGVFLREVRQTSLQTGEGPRVSLSVPRACPTERRPAELLPWSQPMPPENGNVGYPFKLRDAYAFLLNNSAEARRFALEHTGHRACGATYGESRPVLPPASYEWTLTLCDGEAGYEAVVQRSDRSPLGTEDSVVLERRTSRGQATPTWLLPEAMIPLDVLYADGASRLGWEQGPQERFNFRFDASSYSAKVLVAAGSDLMSAKFATVQFIKDGEPAYDVDPVTGALAGVVSPRP